MDEKQAIDIIIGKYSGAARSDRLMRFCQEKFWNWHICGQVMKTNLLDVASIMEMCERFKYSWFVCEAAADTKTLSANDWMKMCVKSRWNDDVCSAAVRGVSLSPAYKRVIALNNSNFKYLAMSADKIRKKLDFTEKFDTTNGNYFIAYLLVGDNRKSESADYGLGYVYEDGRDYRADADYNWGKKYSDGLSVYDYGFVKGCDEKNVLKVKVPYDAVAAVMLDNGDYRIRVSNLHVMHQVGQEDEYIRAQRQRKDEIRKRIWMTKNLRVHLPK